MRYSRAIAALTVISVCVAGAVEMPRPAPEFVISMGSGPIARKIRLSEYRGKTVVLAFILTTCSHCQAVIRGLSKDHEELGPKGLQVVASAIEDMAETALPGFRRQFAPPFPVGYNTNTEAVAFLQHPKSVGFYMPQLVFIDKEGMIRAQFGGRDSLLNMDTQEKAVRDKILEVMKAPSLATKKKK
jgi:thiol-disulfide isomerase/thioredoxin